MKTKLLKKLRKTHYIKYDLISKKYHVHYTIASWNTYYSTPDVEDAFNLYRLKIIGAARDIVERPVRTKLIDVKHAVKPKL